MLTLIDQIEIHWWKCRKSCIQNDLLNPLLWRKGRWNELVLLKNFPYWSRMLEFNCQEEFFGLYTQIKFQIYLRSLAWLSRKCSIDHWLLQMDKSPDVSWVVYFLSCFSCESRLNLDSRYSLCTSLQFTFAVLAEMLSWITTNYIDNADESKWKMF
jgi:hypothetical protein